MADNTEQDRRSMNLIIKGMTTTDTPKSSIANTLSTINKSKLFYDARNYTKT